ncbi:MAG: TRAP transporter small permease subunit [Gammaproteobacteria bacterium]|nr:TRAP transporter small permease subunit [Gammaproteobacteria bacterium]
MPGIDSLTPDTPVVITDPSERGKDDHLWGDRLMVRIGNFLAWLFPVLMLAIVSQVIMRKAGFNQAWLDDAQWWIYGVAMLAAFGYSITNESHVRVDILHQRFSDQKKARIEVFALGWLLLPFIAVMTDILIHYAWASFIAKEGSDSPNGLHRLYLLKISLPVLFLCAGIAAWASLKRNHAKFAHPHFWKLVLAALPLFLFVTERIAFYALWWYIRFTQPDIKSRRIPKEPLMEHSLTIGLCLLAAVLVIAFFKRSRLSERNV